jgi:Ca2+/H+ antiporter
MSTVERLSTTSIRAQALMVVTMTVVVFPVATFFSIVLFQRDSDGDHRTALGFALIAAACLIGDLAVAVLLTKLRHRRD